MHSVTGRWTNIQTDNIQIYTIVNLVMSLKGYPKLSWYLLYIPHYIRSISLLFLVRFWVHSCSSRHDFWGGAKNEFGAQGPLRSYVPRCQKQILPNRVFWLQFIVVFARIACFSWYINVCDGMPLDVNAVCPRRTSTVLCADVLLRNYILSHSFTVHSL